MLVIAEASGRPMDEGMANAFRKLSTLLEVRTYMEELIELWSELDCKGKNAIVALARELVGWQPRCLISPGGPFWTAAGSPIGSFPRELTNGSNWDCSTRIESAWLTH